MLLCTQGTASATEAAWAVNIGGPAYQASDGFSYDPDPGVTNGRPGTLDTVNGRHGW